MYIIMDMGTSNTRLWLCDKDNTLGSKKGAFGAGSSKSHGKEFLFDSLRSLIKELLEENNAKENEVEYILVSGMAGSNIGIYELPHITLPADIYTLADSLKEVTLDSISSVPFVFVPGLKKMNGEEVADVMRGEETETAGILLAKPDCSGSVLVLPGTHNKAIVVDGDGKVTDFYTTFSGELLNCIINNTILAGQVQHGTEIIEKEVLHGAAYAKEKGLNAAIFHVRVMGQNQKSTEELSSFLYGAVLGEDTRLIRSVAAGRKIYIGGKDSLKKVYGMLLGDAAVMLDTGVAEGSVNRGLKEIYKLYKARKVRESLLEAIEREKLIAIVRCPDRDSFIPAMRALYKGGVRLAEITFDRSGKYTKEYTAEMIAALKAEFGDNMLVGAGTVTSEREVMLARNAGASFIISPNCDPEIIKLTGKLGLVSIPAGFTATEIALAVNSGADYVKLFPADQVGAGYVKAVKAPLSDAKLLAVGGVDENNAGEWLKKGFCGVGVGSNLYNKKLIDAGDFDGLARLAAKFVAALN